MSHQLYVVKFNANTNTYLTGYTGELQYENCNWGSAENALTFETMAEVEEITGKINSGTVGTTKP